MNPVQYHKCFESKTKNAHLMTFDNGKEYVVKFYKETEKKALVNEWFAYCVARYLQMPVPYAYLVEIPRNFMEKLPLGNEIQYTKKQFASEYIADTFNGQETTIYGVVNKSQLAQIIVFDYWLCNTDRTKKNILLKEIEPNKHILFVIDHAEIGSSFSWTINDLVQLPQTLMKSATHEIIASFVPTEDEFIKQIKIIQSIPLQLLEEIFNMIPDDWNFTTEEKTNFIQTMNHRRFKMLPKVIKQFIAKKYRLIHQAH